MANPENILGQGFHTNPERINTEGKKPGTRNRSTIFKQWLEMASENGQVADDLVKALIAKASAGDISAIKEAFDSGYGKIPDKQEVDMTARVAPSPVTDKILRMLSPEQLEALNDTPNHD